MAPGMRLCFLSSRRRSLLACSAGRVTRAGPRVQHATPRLAAGWLRFAALSVTPGVPTMRCCGFGRREHRLHAHRLPIAVGVHDFGRVLKITNSVCKSRKFHPAFPSVPSALALGCAYLVKHAPRGPRHGGPFAGGCPENTANRPTPSAPPRWRTVTTSRRPYQDSARDTSRPRCSMAARAARSVPPRRLWAVPRVRMLCGWRYGCRDRRREERRAAGART